jgi:hypothetical protein
MAPMSAQNEVILRDDQRLKKAMLANAPGQRNDLGVVGRDGSVELVIGGRRPNRIDGPVEK